MLYYYLPYITTCYSRHFLSRDMIIKIFLFCMLYLLKNTCKIIVKECFFVRKKTQSVKTNYLCMKKTNKKTQANLNDVLESASSPLLLKDKRNYKCSLDSARSDLTMYKVGPNFEGNSFMQLYYILSNVIIFLLSEVN